MPRKKVKTGSKINKRLSHLLPEFYLRDLLQVILGASILAIPVGFTEEVWRMGEYLPIANILLFMFLSISFIGLFTYYHYKITGLNYDDLIKRTLITYVFSFITVAVLLTLIQRVDMVGHTLISFKRIALVSFPASLSGAIADVLK